MEKKKNVIYVVAERRHVDEVLHIRDVFPQKLISVCYCPKKVTELADGYSPGRTMNKEYQITGVFLFGDFSPRLRKAQRKLQTVARQQYPHARIQRTETAEDLLHAIADTAIAYATAPS